MKHKPGHKMNVNFSRKGLLLLILCRSVNAQSSPIDCEKKGAFPQIYSCLLDRYQQSALDLNNAEVRAQARLENYDSSGNLGQNEDGSIAYEPYIHLARMTFTEQHLHFLKYRMQQCKYTLLKRDSQNKERASINFLKCKTNLNLKQTAWINDYL